MTASSPKARVAFKDRDVRRLIKAVRAECSKHVGTA
jgi:hypothetical protein